MYNNAVTLGVISTINDDWGILIPSSLYNKSTEINIVKNNVVISSFPTFTQADTEVFIPEGTEVSSIIPPGSMVEQTVYIDKYADVYGLCSEFITEFNQKYWVRDFKYETENSPKIQNEISYYEQYFDELKNAHSMEQKFEIYKNKIYPMLTNIWQTFNTSGFLSDPLLSGLQVAYSGQTPGQFITQNYNNKTFTSIATIPNVYNLTAIDQMSNEVVLYLAKPFYENIIYYILLMTKEILNMCDYNNGYRFTKRWLETNIYRI